MLPKMQFDLRQTTGLGNECNFSGLLSHIEDRICENAKKQALALHQSHDCLLQALNISERKGFKGLFQKYLGSFSPQSKYINYYQFV